VSSSEKPGPFPLRTWFSIKMSRLSLHLRTKTPTYPHIFAALEGIEWDKGAGPEGRTRGENIWAQIAVSICVLLLPPVLAFAVLAPHPPGSVSGDILGATEPVAESPSTSVPTTEGSLWPPSRPRQLPGTDLQFEDRFAAAFSHADDIDGQPPAVREELSVQPPQTVCPSLKRRLILDVSTTAS
jgi:hypothetical protein